MTSVEFQRGRSADAKLTGSDTNPGVEVETIIDLTEPDGVVELPLHHTSTEVPILAPGTGLLGASQWQLALKRLIDIVGASLALVLLSPLLAAAAVAVKLSSSGPVFFRQTRVGYNGEPFTFLKFRSMRPGADSVRDDLLDLNEAAGPIFKIKEDPRITPVGRFLRRSSIDELPQLVHVLSGRMSLVGFRPPLPEEVAQYSHSERQRLLIKPGLTCIWQVSGRSDLDFETWIRMDLEYIRNWTLGMDLRLLLRTVGAVLSGRGAY